MCTGVRRDVDGVDLRLLDPPLKVGGDPHRAQWTLLREKCVRIEHLFFFLRPLSSPLRLPLPQPLPISVPPDGNRGQRSEEASED
ncbi:hypothetical protein GW17_00037179 [Ensete ventricosum]|nr:hypothetical protein GW17_00037179 [Ensete ventricosum]RZS05802.1 hypothetical protein BHM03_00036392 [Ensete ventricosum]